MDDLDHRILMLLRHDARQPIAALAAELGVSRATVRARIDRMLKSDVIRGFTVAVRSDAERGFVRAIMLVAVEGRGTNQVLKQLRGFPEVRSLHTTNGRWDIVAELAADTLEAFDATLGQIRLVDGIATTETSILLSTRK